MQTASQFLSPEEQQIIHDESLKILREVGALYHSDRALDILAKNGADVDKDSKIARIPEEMVEQALKTAPKSFVLGARVPEKDFALPSTYSGYVLDNGGIFTRDFKTGERRNANFQDHKDFLRVFDEMKLASVVWGTTIHEFPNHSSGIRTDLTSFIYSSLHIQDELSDPKEVPYIIEKMVTTLPLAMSGVDLIQGPGALETSNMMAMEQIVVDDEIACFCKRIRDGIDMSAAKNYFDDIRDVKPGGHFLMQPNTLEACHSNEFMQPALCNRSTFEEYLLFLKE